MKILFAHDHIFLTKDGAVYSNTFSYEILKRYVDVFSEVTIVARHREVSDTEEMLLSNGNGVSFVFLESIASVRSYFGLRQSYEKKLKRLVKEHDAVIVKLPSEFGLITAKIARREQKRYLAEVVGCAWDAMWNYGGVKAKIYAPFLFFKMKNSVKRSNYTTYVTKQFLQERYPSSKKARIIGISDVELPDSDEETLSKRVKKIENLGEKIVFGTIGSLTVQYKGIDTALKALAEIAGKYNNFEYHILGEGDPTVYKRLADELGISDKVFFDGTLARGEAVLDWLDRLDIYLQPSLVEGLPRSLVEALSRGCPAIGSSVGGIPELLDKKMLFRPDYPEQLSEKIGAFMNDKHLMIETATQNFNKAKQYQKSMLDEKRKKFWMDFRDDLL